MAPAAKGARARTRGDINHLVRARRVPVYPDDVVVLRSAKGASSGNSGGSAWAAGPSLDAPHRPFGEKWAERFGRTKRPLIAWGCGSFGAAQLPASEAGGCLSAQRSKYRRSSERCVDDDGAGHAGADQDTVSYFVDMNAHRDALRQANPPI